MALGPSHSFVI